MPKAFITGISGQDGSYLAELLLEKDYEVHGLDPCAPAGCDPPPRNLAHLPKGSLRFHDGDLRDFDSLCRILDEIAPDEVYNLGARSHVGDSFDNPMLTMDVTGMGPLRLLEAIRRLPEPPRFFQASSAEIFGKVSTSPQREETPFHPRSPYGCAKAFAHLQTVNHREAFDLFACNGILFNHESPRRSPSFVTRKITRAAARIRLGLQDKLSLGNLDARRDWGFARDYVEAMWRMLQHDRPDDFVIATGRTHTVRDFLDAAFDAVGLPWEDHVVIDPAFFRPAEAEVLVGDPAKARRRLGWSAATDLQSLVRIMVDADLKEEGPS